MTMRQPKVIKPNATSKNLTQALQTKTSVNWNVDKNNDIKLSTDHLIPDKTIESVSVDMKTLKNTLSPRLKTIKQLKGCSLMTR